MAESTKTLAPLFTWRSAISASGLKPTTRHVAIALSLYMSERGDSAHPGATRLAEDTGLSVRAIRDHLAKLHQAGWLGIVEHGGLVGEVRRANSYVARVPDTPLPLQEVHPCSTRTRAPKRATPLQETAHTPAGGSPQLISDYSSDLTKVSVTSLAVRSGFDEFWTAYPRRNGKRIGKRDAEHTWKRLTATEQAVVLVAVVNYAAACDAGRTIAADAFRWLQKRRWEDWLEPDEPTMSAPKGMAAISRMVRRGPA